MRKARFVIPVVALGGLAIGSFMLLRRRRNQTPWALARPGLWVALDGLLAARFDMDGPTKEFSWRQAPTLASQSAKVADLSPTEAIEHLISDADDAVAAELLDRVLTQPPGFLERLPLRLLQAMGYGGKEALLTHTGKPGDAGLDGVIRQDALGLDLVGVQAKRYDRESAVQRPEMQAFVGALQGAQTSRGVFVTTGRFSSGGRLFADQVAMRLVLIDGTELARLMVRTPALGSSTGRTGSSCGERATATIMTAKTVGWTIGITLLLVVLLSAVATVLYGISLWLVETYSPD